MSYKTILVHVDETKRSSYRIELAAALAKQYDAHLLGVASTGMSRFIYQDGNIGGIDPTIITELNHLRERANQSVADFKEQAAKMGVASFSGEVAQDDACGGVGLRARYCDLVVLGQTHFSELSLSVANDFPEYMMLHSGRPVLVVPYAGQFTTIGHRVMIAWNGSVSSTRAITYALPFLQQASVVQVVIINPQNEMHGDQPGADLATYLVRHGVQLEVMLHRTNMAIGETLLSLSADLNSDLLVMGGYGHSRFTEMIMGGATHVLLKSMTVPVFFAH